MATKRVIIMRKGDVLDRLSIVLLKTIYRDDLENEVYSLEELFANFDGDDANILIALLEANNGIWQLESAIRKDKKMSFEEMGRRTAEIRKLNRQRVSIKNNASKNGT